MVMDPGVVHEHDYVRPYQVLVLTETHEHLRQEALEH